MPAQKTKTKNRSSRRTSRSAKPVNISKIQNAKNNVMQTFDQINRVLSRFENEAESLLKRLVKQGERSRREIMKNFEELLSKVRADHILARAHERREGLEKEIRRRAEEIIEGFREMESLLNNRKVRGVVQNAKHSLDSLLAQFGKTPWLSQAKHTVEHTVEAARKEALGLLSVPTCEEVEKLERKVVSLEKRLSHLSRKAA